MITIEKLNYWLNSSGDRCCYSLSYHEESEILHVYNLAYPKSTLLYNALCQSPHDFIGKIRNQIKFVLKSELPAKIRIFYYDRSQIVYEFDPALNRVLPLAEDEWFLLYTPYLKPLPSGRIRSKRGVSSE